MADSYREKDILSLQVNLLHFIRGTINKSLSPGLAPQLIAVSRDRDPALAEVTGGGDGVVRDAVNQNRASL